MIASIHEDINNIVMLKRRAIQPAILVVAVRRKG
jgi:hypothetical protein